MTVQFTAKPPGASASSSSLRKSAGITNDDDSNSKDPPRALETVISEEESHSSSSAAATSSTTPKQPSTAGEEANDSSSLIISEKAPQHEVGKVTSIPSQSGGNGLSVPPPPPPSETAAAATASKPLNLDGDSDIFGDSSSSGGSSDEFYTEPLKPSPLSEEASALSSLPQPPSSPESDQIATQSKSPKESISEEEQDISNLPSKSSPGDPEHEDDNNRDDEEDITSTKTDDDDDSDADLSLLWKARLLSGKIVNYEYVQVGIIFLIIINAFMMGLGTFDFVTDDPKVQQIFEDIDRAFLVVFTLEVAMQLFYLGMTLFSDGWLVFDFFIVVFSWSFESLQIVRAFRIFRAFRLITRVKPLRDLVLAIGAVLPRMYAIGSLLLLVFYIFSVLFTELFKDLQLSANYFKTLDASLFTCMELMTLEWAGIAREVMEEHKWAWAPFATFIAMTGFIVFNLIVAVVCDAVAVTEKTVREMDGIESDNPHHKLDEAQERIDLLQCHIDDMLQTQQAIQDMIEIMAGELLHLEAERLKHEEREYDMKLELERMVQYERSMEATRKSQMLERAALRRSNSNTSLSASRHDSSHDRRSMNRRQNSNGSLSTSKHGSSHSRRNVTTGKDSSRSPVRSKTSFVAVTDKSPKPFSRRMLLSDTSYRSNKSSKSGDSKSRNGSKSKLSIATGSDRSLLSDDYFDTVQEG